MQNITKITYNHAIPISKTAIPLDKNGIKSMLIIASIHDVSIISCKNLLKFTIDLVDRSAFFETPSRILLLKPNMKPEIANINKGILCIMVK